MSIRIPSYRPLVSAALSVLALASASLTSSSAAQRGAPPRPPQEALDACADLVRGASCSVETPHGTLEGTCVAPEGLPLACMPAHPPGDRRGPPPEALNACTGHAPESSCLVETPHGSLSGFCHAPEGRPLACVPPHHGMLPEALEACSGVEVGEACALDTPRGAHEGRCGAGPEGTMCRLPPPGPPTSPSASEA